MRRLTCDSLWPIIFQHLGRYFYISILSRYRNISILSRYRYFVIITIIMVNDYYGIASHVYIAVIKAESSSLISLNYIAFHKN